MKTIWEYIRAYFEEEWHTGLFGGTALFLVLAFAANYGFHLEDRIVAGLRHPLQQCFFYFLFYGLPFAVTVTLSARTKGGAAYTRRIGFYLLSAFFFLLLAVYVVLHNVPAYLDRHGFLSGIVAQEYRWYFTRYASNMLPGLGILLPVFLYWFRHDRHTSRFYGFSASRINLRTYFGILLLLMPVVAAASFGSDFQATYPRHAVGFPHGVTGTERWLLVGGFEFCYGVDFVFVEMLFRGFMVMAFARYLGSGAVLPMVVVYAFIHFQKPMGEAIGSIAGGLVLGIISYRTRSIYGGIILHLGVAYLMEIAGTVQLFLR